VITQEYGNTWGDEDIGVKYIGKYAEAWVYKNENIGEGKGDSGLIYSTQHHFLRPQDPPLPQIREFPRIIHGNIPFLDTRISAFGQLKCSVCGCYVMLSPHNNRPIIIKTTFGVTFPHPFWKHLTAVCSPIDYVVVTASVIQIRSNFKWCGSFI
jgi:hypothetical protein